MQLNKVQKQCIKELLKNMPSVQKQIIAWYTGAGKTNILMGLCRELIRINPKIKIGISAYLHVNIKNQTTQRALQFGLNPKEISGTKDYAESNLYIFNPQSAYKMERSLDLDLLIIDEAHVATSDERSTYFNQIIERHCKPGFRLIGASATPWDATLEEIFKGATVLKRGMDLGYENDHRVQDFKIHAERTDLKIADDDYSRIGDIKESFIKENFSSVKANCLEKVKSIIKKHNSKIGAKCLIIVPPGDNCAIAKELKVSLGSKASYLIGERHLDLKRDIEVINEFKANHRKKYLIVVNKCQLGFDMPELTSAIDLTMTRNIKLVVQRWGRLARKNSGDNTKNYFYIFDDSLSPERVEWIFGTAMEYAICKWDSENSKNKIKYKETKIYNISKGSREFDITFSSLMANYTTGNISTYKTIRFSDYAKKRDSFELSDLIRRARVFKDRTNLSRFDRVTYNKLRENHNDELNRLFPIKNELHKWTKAAVLAAARKCRSLNEFKKLYPGAMSKAEVKKWDDEVRKILPPQYPKRLWDKKKALALAKKYKRVSTFRALHNGAYSFLMKHHKGEVTNIFNKNRNSAFFKEGQ